jgi:hypothetical protein
MALAVLVSAAAAGLVLVFAPSIINIIGANDAQA